MALYRHCVSKLSKTNFVLSSATLTVERSPPFQRVASISRRTIWRDVTASCRGAASLQVGTVWHGGHREESRKEKRSTFPLSLMFVPAILKGSSNSESKEESSLEQDLVNHIKRSILMMQNGETEKAERLLHVALKMAQDMKHEKGITYIYDTMANLAFENGEFAKAQKLFVEVLRRLVGSGLPHDDMVVINISLKVADTFIGLGDDEKGEQGFLFCLDTLKKKISSGALDEDTLMLYSQTLDRYSLYLVHSKKPNEALQHMNTALGVAESVLGDLNNKVGAILLSDMGVVQTAAGDKDGAALSFEKALLVANREEVDASVAVILVNRGMALKENGAFEDAKHWCELGLAEALKEKSRTIKKAAEECMKANSNNENDSNKRQTYTAV